MGSLRSITARLDSLKPGRIELGLDGVLAGAAALGDPHEDRARRWALIAGTNGKGSTVEFLTQILIASGLRVGVYTSPHLHNVRERIRVGAEPIGVEPFTRLVEQVLAVIDDTLRLTYFEVLTLVALLHFREAAVDVGVLEVGLGGRLDATNIVMPSVSVVTSIGLDHTDWLGDTLGAIAWEKGGVTRPGVPLITAASESLIEPMLEGRPRPSCVDRMGQQFQTALLEGRWSYSDDALSVDRVRIGMAGAHQAENAALATRAALSLVPGLEAAQVAEGVTSASVPGRLEAFSRGGVQILLDGAHNVAGAEALSRFLATQPAHGHYVGVLGYRSNREPQDLLAPLAEALGSVVATSAHAPSMWSASALAERLRSAGFHPAFVTEDPAHALADAIERAGPGGTVLVTGSLYLVGEARQLLGPKPGS